MPPTVIATCAFPGTYDILASVELHLSYIDEAAAAGARLVVFPEISLQGYPPAGAEFGGEAVLLRMLETAEAVPGGPNVARLIAAAAERRIHVVFGATEAGRHPGNLYNTLVLAGPAGYLGCYRKVHVAVTELMYWRPGDEWAVFETELGTIGPLICYDLAWPEACRELTLAGSQLFVMGTAWCALPGHGDGEANLWARQYDVFTRARAAENARWLIASNFVGEFGGLTFFGLSRIVDPVGEVVASSDAHTPGLILAEIDIPGGLAAATAVNLGSFLVRDRRPDTYRILNGSRPIAADG
jgi:predicted amidohydrolase